MQATCQHCGIEFHIAAGTRGRFCSKACYSAYRVANPGAYRKHPLATLTCRTCGKTFQRRHHEIRSEAQYCSKKCAGIANGPTNGTTPRGAQVVKICEACGKEFSVKHSKSLRRRFCGKDCYNAHRSQTLIGESNPNYRHGRSRGAAYHSAIREYPKRCAVCGFDIAVQVHHIKPLAHGGQNNPDNLIILCPNHHAMAELGLLSGEELTAHATAARLR